MGQAPTEWRYPGGKPEVLFVELGKSIKEVRWRGAVACHNGKKVRGADPGVARMRVIRSEFHFREYGEPVR